MWESRPSVQPSVPELVEPEATPPPPVLEFVDVLRGTQFKAILSGLGGYGAAITGKQYDINEAIPSPAQARLRAPTHKQTEAS